MQLGPGAEVPDWAESSSLFSITATALETSLVCAARNVPKKAKQAGPFTPFAVQGPLDFSLVGVLATLLQPIAEAEISVLTISTFDTDWLLVPVGDAERAAEAWRTAGHEVVVADAGRGGTTSSGSERAAQDQTQGEQRQMSVTHPAGFTAAGVPAGLKSRGDKRHPQGHGAGGQHRGPTTAPRRSSPPTGARPTRSCGARRSSRTASSARSCSTPAAPTATPAPRASRPPTPSPSGSPSAWASARSTWSCARPA